MPPPTPLTILLTPCRTGEEMADALLSLEAKAARLRLPPPPGAGEDPAERRSTLARSLQAEIDAFHARMEAAFAEHGMYPVGDSLPHRVAWGLPPWYGETAAAPESRQRLPWWRGPAR